MGIRVLNLWNPCQPLGSQTGYPYPSLGVGVSVGMGKGTVKKPVGYPGHSL